MKKIKLHSIITLTFVALASLIAGVSFAFVTPHKVKTPLAFTDPTTVNVPFLLGEVNRQANGYDKDNNAFTYTADEKEFVGAVNTNLINGQSFMLRNHKAQNAYTLGNVSLQEIKNIYISFGAPFNSVMDFNEEAGESYGKNGTLLNYLAVKPTLNGRVIKTNRVQEETIEPSLPGAQTKFQHWFDYFDLKNLEYDSEVDSGEKVTDPQGEYKFEFSYMRIVYENGIYRPENQRTFSISFYLIDETAYSNNYPAIQNAEVGKPQANTNIQQLYYNFQTLQLPTLEYDPSLYNITLTKTVAGKQQEIITSKFEKNSQFPNGLVTYTSNLQGTSFGEVIINNNLPSTKITWENLGEYDILIEYVVLTSQGYKTITHQEIPAYDINIEKYNDPVDAFAKSKYKLHVFGFKSYFTLEGKEVNLEFDQTKLSSETNRRNFGINFNYDTTIKQNVVSADYTSKINAIGLQNGISIENGLYAKYMEHMQAQNPNFKDTYPITNLPPVTFANNVTEKLNSNNTQQLSRVYKYGKEFLTKVEVPNTTPIEETYQTPQTIVFTKDTEIDGQGYYEVVVAYTYSKYNTEQSDATTTHYQVFVFNVNMETPTAIRNTTHETNINNIDLVNDVEFDQIHPYTSNNFYVYFKTPTHFMWPATIVVENYSYENQLLSTQTIPQSQIAKVVNPVDGLTYSATPIFNQNGKYVIKLYYAKSSGLHVEYEMIIDNNDIEDINFSPIDLIKDSSGNETYSIVNDKEIVDISNKLLINQPFTLTYSPKQSGAKITTTYQKIPFNSYLGGGTEVSPTYLNFITAKQSIDYTKIESKSEFNLDYSTLTTGIVNYANARFVDDKSYIYIFTITDQAGNEFKKHIIYDLTTPEVLIRNANGDNAINNAYNVVSEETTIKWGTHKAVLLEKTNTDITNTDFKKLIENNPTHFTQLHNNYYMIVPITYANFNIVNSNELPYNFVATSGTFKPSITIYPQNNTASDELKFFSGEKSYRFTVSDTSKISSSTNLNKNKSNVYSNFIDMNNDNSLAFVYGKTFQRNSNEVSQETEYGESLTWGRWTPTDKKASETNANQLRITYLPGEPDSDYEVKSFTYNYYEFAPNSYANIESGKTSNTYTPSENEPFAEYPFLTTPSRRDYPVGSSSNLKIVNRVNAQGAYDPNGVEVVDQNRLVSEVINFDVINSREQTKPGLYVFKRVYNKQETPGNTLDPVTRYYYIIVDREKIINIDPNALDIDLNEIQISTQNNDYLDSILYDTGSGINFKFTNNSNDLTRYSSKEIQTLIDQTGIYNQFTTNKLPVKLTLPIDKYNTKLTLSKSEDAKTSNNSAYIAQVANKNNFAMSYVITHGLSNELVFDNYNTKIDGNPSVWRQEFVSIITNSVNGASTLNFDKQGNYSVTLYTTKSAERLTGAHLPTSYTFEFTVEHTSPQGNFYTKYSDGSDKLITQEKNTGVEFVQFNSINNTDLKFEFIENVDRFKAIVDPNNIVINRVSSSGVKTEIYKRSETAGGAIMETVQGVFSSRKNEQGLNVYSLNLNTFINNTQFNDLAIYIVTLKYVGLETDYIVGNTNYFKRDFILVVDQIKPQHNLNQLKQLDAQKFNAQKSEVEQENYFYPVTSEFMFRAQNNYTYNYTDNSTQTTKNLFDEKLDSATLYFRPLFAENNSTLPTYYHSITQDNPLYESPTHSNHPRFSETHEDFVNNKFSYNTTPDGTVIYAGVNKHDSPAVLDRLSQTYGTQYFEVVEIDEAGNHTVYAIQYFNAPVNPTIVTTHKIMGQTTTTTTTITQNNHLEAIKGKELAFDTITNGSMPYADDLFIKAIVTNNANGNVSEIVNKPHLNTPTNSLSSFISQINTLINSLTETYKPENQRAVNGYNITIEIVNRFGENYLINYIVPGERQKPIFVNNSNETEFSITIPQDTTSAFIKGFKAFIFEKGQFVPVTSDGRGTTIRESLNGQSLQGQVYHFTRGEYMFQLIDNFDRGADITIDSPFYHGLGVNDENSINYGTQTQIVNNLTYTASDAILRYQENLYKLTLYKYEVIEGVLQEIEITNLEDENIPNRTDNNGIRTLTFQNLTFGTEKRYSVKLEFLRFEQVHNYDFVLYKKLPTISLRTSSGSYLDPLTSPFTEDVVLSWGDDVLDFNSFVNLERTYIGADGKQSTQKFNVTTGYIVDKVGTYKAQITNSLGYTNPANNLRFEIIDGEIINYQVFTNENGYKTEVSASPVKPTININGNQKVVYKYYVLSKFNQTNNPSNSVDIILNTAKALTVSQVPYQVQNSQLFLISGTSNDFPFEQYIEIVYVDQSNNFTNLSITYPNYDEDGNETSPGAYSLQSTITTTKPYLSLSFDAFNKISSNVNNEGNIIYLRYTFNGKEVETLYNLNGVNNSIILKTAGIYKFYFQDQAGNTQTFLNSKTNTYANELTINLINNVTFEIDNDNPINNYIKNDLVQLKITNINLYKSSNVTISATLNGKSITAVRDGTDNFVYTFNTHGYYEVTLKAQVQIEGQEEPDLIETKYSFILINSKQKLIAFNIPQNYGFTIEQLVHEGNDITNMLSSAKNELWLSQHSTGFGQYNVIVKGKIDGLNIERTFNFSVYIYDKIPEINASIEFGTSTTKKITIEYNPRKIYEEIGEAILRIRLGNKNIDELIGSDSQNATLTKDLTENGVYFIEILTKDGRIVASYKLEKSEPLNTTAIIIIIVVSVVVVGLTVVFIILRRRVKFR